MIGPRCALCRKGRKYHGKILNGCPVGKRRNGAYSEFHPTNKFTPREPRKKAGSEKRKDRVTRRAVKAEPCCACGTPPGNPLNPVDCCHVRSWKVSQCDEPFNQIPMCRFHHDMQHKVGWLIMSRAFVGVRDALGLRDWIIEVNESTGDWSMFNEKEVEMNRKRRAV